MVEIAPISPNWLDHLGPVDHGRPLESIYRAEFDTIWVDSDPLYGRWRWRPSPRVLWITGPPACGKSVLARHLVESEKALDEDLKLCYYFFPSHTAGGAESRIELLCRSILGQILKLDPETASSLPPFESVDGGAYEHLLSTLSRPHGDPITTEGQKTTFICILDGLDDLSDAESPVFQTLFGLATDSADQRYDLKFLITGRYIHPILEPEPEDTLRMVIRLEDHKPQFDRCLERFLRRRLAEKGVSDPDEAKLADLVATVDGSFLAANDALASPAVTGLEGMDLLEKLCDTAKTFPESLRRAYESALARTRDPITDDDLEFLKLMLIILTVAIRPLTAEEVWDAEMSRMSSGDIKGADELRICGSRRCGGLIASRERGYTVIHRFRIQDYLGECIRLSYPFFDSKDAVGYRYAMNFLMLGMCFLSIRISSGIRGLNENTSVPPEESQLELLKQHPFLEYASTSWMIHFNAAEALVADARSGLAPAVPYRILGALEIYYGTALRYCDPKSPPFLTWFPLFWKAAHSTTPPPKLDTDGLTKLMVASYVNLTIGVHQVFTSSQESTITRQDRRGQTALHIAVSRGHLRTVRAFNGRYGMHTLVRELVNKKDNEGQTALHYAVKHRQPGVVVALMDFPGIDLNAQDLKGRTALHYAAHLGEDGMVWGLLDGNATVDIEDSADDTPSDYARRVLQLIEKGIIGGDELADKFTKVAAVVRLLEKAEMAGVWLLDVPLLARKAVDNLFEIEFTLFTRVFDSKHHERFPVWDFLRNGVTEWARDQRLKHGVGWLHVPANNMTWVEILIKKLEPHRIRMGTRERILRKELWANCQHRGSPGYYHATFMNPQCHPLQPGQGKQEALCLYMPYIHWETMDTMLTMSATFDMMRKNQLQEFKDATRKNRHQALLYHYLDRPNPLHIRRTLDQYHYYNLEDTTIRDKDQLFSRVFAGKPPSNRPVLMVDQLWLWRLPDGTIITSFPDRWSRDGSEPGREDHLDRYDRTDVFKNIKRKLDSVKSSNDLITLVIGECLEAYFDPSRQAGTFPNVLEIYGNEIGRITDIEARLLKDFSQNVKNLTNTTPRKEAVDIVDPVMEMELLREIKDIMDELQTMNEIFTDQKDVLSELLKLIHNSKSKTVAAEIRQHELTVLVRSRQGEVDLMIGQARATSRALNDLIDLKQKFSNVLEARWARNMAEETSRQGTTILVFTIATIVFLPLSFMAAFFALDISQFPKMEDGGLDLDFVSTYIFSMSAAVVVPLLLIAFNVDWVTRLRDSTKASIIDKSEIISKDDAYYQNRPDKMNKEKETMRQRLRKLRAAESGPKDKQRTMPSLPLATFFRYILVILPIGEVRFACLVMLKGAEMLHLTQTINRPTVLLAGGSEGADVGEPEQARWKIRPGLTRSWTVFLGVIRLLFLPLWISMLCVEVLVGGIIYGLLALVLETNPLQTLVKEVWNSTLLSLYW